MSNRLQEIFETPILLNTDIENTLSISEYGFSGFSGKRVSARRLNEGAKLDLHFSSHQKRVSIALLWLDWIIIIKYLFISIIDHFLSGRNGNHLQERSMYLTFSLVQQKSLESGLEILRQKDTEVCNHIKLHQRENGSLSEIQSSNDHTFTTDLIHI